MTDSTEKTDFSENPFVGPHPIETGRNIFGRNREIDDLYYLLSAERIVMLHSPSGAGKTSLIQAGLIPRLSERFDVWGPTRVNQLPSANSPATVNRYIRSAVLGFEQQVPDERRRTEDQLGEMTLAEYVASRREESKNIVLIFDQFEEILTADPLAIEAKREFFKQLGELLLDPRIWALFAMREDYLPALDPYAEQVPTHLKNWFRLDLLRRDKATEAITETAKEGGRQFDPEAVTGLVTDLATMKVQQPDGTFAPQKGLYVEPLQLQVVCRRLWERMSADKQTIDLAEIEESGDVTNALADYYSAEVARLANGDVRVERKLREWVGERLITPDGIRSQVLRGAGKSEGLDNGLVASLVNTHLVRGEQREGATWYELAHDRLIEPIRNNNRDWFDIHLHKVQKLASLWEREGRPDGLLLLCADLIEAKQWEAQNEFSLTAVERKFLEVSITKQEAIEREQRQARRLRLMLAAIVVVALFAMVAAGKAYYSSIQATKAETIAKGEKATAEREKANAENSALNARIEQGKAEIASCEADRHRGIAEKNGRFLEKSLGDSRNMQYTNNQLLAWNAFDQKNYLRVNDLLEAQYPAPGTSAKEDLRSLDWFYLWRQIHDEKQTLRGHTSRVLSVSFSPNGKTLASGSWDKTLRLWDVISGKELRKLEGHSDAIYSVSFSPDGRTMASGSNDKTLRLWDVKSGKVLHKLKGHASTVLSVSFSPDGRTLASGSADETVRLWDVQSGKELRKLEGHTWVVNSVSFSPDGRTLASGSGDGTVNLWDVQSGKELRSLKGPTSADILSVSFSPDGRMLASGSLDKIVRLWDVRSGEVLRKLEGHTSGVLSVSFSLNGRTLASGSTDNTVVLWNLVSGKELRKLEGHAGFIRAVSFLPDGQTLASGSDDQTVKLWDVVGEKGLEKLEGHTNSVRSVSFSPNGQMLASGSLDRTVRLWDMVSGKVLRVLGNPSSNVLSVSFSPDGQTVASGSLDKTVKLWDVKSGQEMATLCCHSAGVFSVVFSPNGRTLASGSDDWTVKLWDMTSRRESRELKHASRVTSVSFSPDGQMLASGSEDRTVRLWDVVSGKELRKLEGHADFVTSVSFSPDGRTLASGSKDQTVKIWDVASKQEKATLRGHVLGILSVSFSPDGRMLASGSDDRTVKLWDVASKQEKATLRRHSGFVNSISFSPDGRMLACGVGGIDTRDGNRNLFGEILIWRAATKEKAARQCIHCGQKN